MGSECLMTTPSDQKCHRHFLWIRGDTFYGSEGAHYPATRLHGYQHIHWFITLEQRWSSEESMTLGTNLAVTRRRGSVEEEAVAPGRA
jgi:hypothetical protein